MAATETTTAGPPTGDDVAVVVVNHDAGPTLAAFVASLRPERVGDVVVVDNASTDGSSDEVAGVPGVRVVRTGANLGYGSGVNRGLAVTGAELVLVSNPDVVVHRGTVAALAAAFAADATLAIAGPCIRAVDGSRYPSARRFPSMTVAAGHALLGLVAPGNRFSRRYRMEGPGAAHSRGGADDEVDDRFGGGAGEEPGASAVPVDWVSGACFMARGQALKELGGFDESYFMYLEDVDLCWRAHRAGWAVAYVPGAQVTHVQGMSTARRPYRMLLAHHRSAFRFASRTAEGWHRVTLPAAAVVLAVRLAVASSRQALGTLRKITAQGD